MNLYMHHSTMKRYIASTTLLVLLLLAVLGGTSYIQAVYTEPISDPPASNVDVPVNLDDDFQDVVGGIEASVIGVSYGIALPGSPPTGGSRTAVDGWPTGTDTASCHLEVRRVDWSGGVRTFELDTGASLGQYPTCNDYLTDTAKTTDHWAPTGADNCLGTDGTDCAVSAPQSTCIYTRLVCPTGITVVDPLFSTSTYAGGLITLPIQSSSTNPL